MPVGEHEPYLKNHETPGSLPTNCTFLEKEWRVLAGSWHPVALGAELREKTIQVRLLDETLVVYHDLLLYSNKAFSRT
jgi:phenylpropionate dioxygenase-like ring-hydroxylating dioxygenase large terminal subunit